MRISNLQAAVGLAQLERLNDSVSRKREIGARYQDRLSDMTSLTLPLERTSYADNLYWVFGTVLDDALPWDAAGLEALLAASGIGTRPFFWPLHDQPVLREMNLAGDRALPVAERLGRRGLYLPSGLGLTNEQQDRVCDELSRILVDA